MFSHTDEAVLTRILRRQGRHVHAYAAIYRVNWETVPEGYSAIFDRQHIAEPHSWVERRDCFSFSGSSHPPVWDRGRKYNPEGDWIAQVETMVFRTCPSKNARRVFVTVDPETKKSPEQIASEVEAAARAFRERFQFNPWQYDKSYRQPGSSPWDKK